MMFLFSHKWAHARLVSESSLCKQRGSNGARWRQTRCSPNTSNSKLLVRMRVRRSAPRPSNRANQRVLICTDPSVVRHRAAPPPECSAHGPKLMLGRLLLTNVTYVITWWAYAILVQETNLLTSYLTKWLWDEPVRKERARLIFCVKTCDHYREGLLAGTLPRDKNVFFASSFLPHLQIL